MNDRIFQSGSVTRRSVRFTQANSVSAVDRVETIAVDTYARSE